MKTRLVRQEFPEDSLDDCRAVVRAELSRIDIAARLRPRMRVAIAVGSRGIARYAEITASLISVIRAAGAEPFIVPAMGSHAGGTAESQRELLVSAGFGENLVGAPIRSSMETLEVGRMKSGFKVFVDRLALEADFLIVINRIKPHTDFTAPVESGVTKMLVVGLGKREGAAECHCAFSENGFFPTLTEAREIVLSKVRFLCALAIVENERHGVLKIEAIKQEALPGREKVLLELAKRRMARIPFKKMDLLVVDEIGKDLSGSGMDLNVVGRKKDLRFAGEGEYPKARFIYVRGLSLQTHGNANGIGIADFIHDRVYEGIDFGVTNMNCLTSGTPHGAAIPMRMINDRTTVDAVQSVCRSGAFRLVRIKNTLDLRELLVSEDTLPELDPDFTVEVDEERFDLSYDSEGNFAGPFFPSGAEAIDSPGAENFA
jgi:hypothetical protein